MGSAQTVVAAMVGIAGLGPVLAAAKAGKRIALANKETLVAGGHLVTTMAEAHGALLIPVDSEHSAIFQCLSGRTATYAGWSKGAAAKEARQIGDSIKKLILTASGGPFRGFTPAQLAKVTSQQALQHPNWSMGAKVTIDSATLMNKGLEMIEAHWLFNIEPERIQPIIHPQSIIHSMVEFIDGTVIAQMGSPDMRLPIQLAITWPKRRPNDFKTLDFTQMQNLTFEQPDRQAFPCLDLAFAALREGGTMPAVMNGANEAAVNDFLAGKIGFTEIPKRVAEAMEQHRVISQPVLAEILAADMEGRGILE
jgi:1-deoxy-D-xylulose-5-phosphate reductoisomerase